VAQKRVSCPLVLNNFEHLIFGVIL